MTDYRSYNESLVSKVDPKMHKEWINILDRYLLNYYNTEKSTAAIKEACLQKAKDECVEKGIKRETIDKIIIVDIPKIDIKKIPEYNSLYSILKLKHPNKTDIEYKTTVIKYYLLGINGQQWSTTDDFKKSLENKYPNLTEAFASPLNHTLKRYFSIFESDATFGSLGNFFDNKDYNIPLYINPPFTEYILSKAVDTALKYKKFVMITPTWSDAKWYIKLKNSPDVKVIVKPIGSVEYVDKMRVFKPWFETTIWLKNMSL